MLLKCYQTFSNSEVCYVGPKGNESTEATSKRRNLMTLKVERFELTQVRHALSMTNSSVSTKKLLVTLETMINKFDHGLAANGLERSNLCGLLREIHHLRNDELKEKKSNEGTWENTVYEEPEDLYPLDIVDGERKRLCREFRSDINKEHTLCEGKINTAHLTILDEDHHDMEEPENEDELVAAAGQEGPWLTKVLTQREPPLCHVEMSDQQLAKLYEDEAQLASLNK